MKRTNWPSSLRKRDGKTITFTYEGLNRGRRKTVAASTGVPTLAELQTLLAEPCPSSGPCVVNPMFQPTARFLYWTSTTLPRDFIGISYAWGVFFNVGGAIDVDKNLGMRGRARSG